MHSFGTHVISSLSISMCFCTIAIMWEKLSTVKCFLAVSLLPPFSHYSSFFAPFIPSSTDPKQVSSWLLCLLSGSFLSVCLSVRLLWLGLLLGLTAAALTSVTSFSCLMRHQTLLAEATVPHRRTAAAKLCSGTHNRKRSRTLQNKTHLIRETVTLVCFRLEPKMNSLQINKCYFKLL